MLEFDERLVALAIAIVIDAMLGDPGWLWSRIPHPVVWAGHAIGALDAWLNRPADTARQRRLIGLVTVVVLILLVGAIGWALSALLAASGVGIALEAFVVAVLIAQRSLYDHVADVARGLEQGGVAGGREAVAHIVGRDPNSLDEAGVVRAAIESTAENFADGVVAPALWYLIAGLPGILVYKLINTADSMIGHKTERHRDFGWAAAKIDDLVNWPAARLSGLLIAGAALMGGFDGRRALQVMRRDAGSHTSPNAGWPEAAMAGALGIALAGPRRYQGRLTDDPYLNEEGDKEPSARDIRRALRVFVLACLIQFVIVALTAFVVR